MRFHAFFSAVPEQGRIVKTFLQGRWNSGINSGAEHARTHTSTVGTVGKGKGTGKRKRPTMYLHSPVGKHFTESLSLSCATSVSLQPHKRRRAGVRDREGGHDLTVGGHP